MPMRWYSVVVDCLDVAAQADWWSRVLEWPKVYEAPDEVGIIPSMERGPGLVFVPVPEAKTVKNQLHLDLAPRADEDQAAAVDRLLALGATRADVGQSADVTWVVLADPRATSSACSAHATERGKVLLCAT